MDSKEVPVEETFDLVEKRIDKGHIKDAQAKLEEIRSYGFSDLPLIHKAKVYYLFAKLLFKQGHYKKALYKIKVALRLSSNINDHSFYASAKFTYGYILFLLGRPYDAEGELIESYAYYKRVKNHRMIALPLNILAQVHYYHGNIRRAGEVLEQVIQHETKHNFWDQVDIDKRNFVRVLVATGQFEKAEEMLDQIAIKHDDLDGCASSFMLRGALKVLMLDYEEAITNLNLALSFLNGAGSNRHVGVCIEYLGLLEYNRGNYDAAKEYFQQILEMPEPTASATAQTLRMMADVYIAEGKYDKALKTARKAREAINKINERKELYSLFKSYGEIYSGLEEPDKARDYFEKSISLLGELGALYDMALTHLACGQSNAYDNEERLKNLIKAKELFNDMKVPAWVQRASDAIQALKKSTFSKPSKTRKGNTAPVIITVNKVMKNIVSTAEDVSNFSVNILLTGQTGTGKDLLAKYIHWISGRKGDLITVNSAAIPNEIIESELFGYVKGAFTGANRDKPGLFEMAENGTFYLNEIADATPEFQAKLLEVLESSEIRRLGENKKRLIKFQLVSATNYNLDELVKKKQFRPDLFHRLNEFPINIPPLKERIEDIPSLVGYFLGQLDGLMTDNGYGMHLTRLGEILARRDWPGNVRELLSEVKRLWLVGHGSLKKMVKLADDRKQLSKADDLLETLDKTNWNRRETARRFGVSDTTIRRWIWKYNLSEPDSTDSK
jgi:DNA-binding NtrC family response regulator/predicted negative regulator of RcsB-dependent stress response